MTFEFIESENNNESKLIDDYTPICPECNELGTFWHDSRCSDCNQTTVSWCPNCERHLRKVD